MYLLGYVSGRRGGGGCGDGEPRRGGGALSLSCGSSRCTGIDDAVALEVEGL